MKILLAPTFDLAKNCTPALTVEAEYGMHVVMGSQYTAAHHQPSGPYAGRHLVAGGRPSPCNDKNIPTVGDDIILVSHIDLDTLGGCLRADPRFTNLFHGEQQGFWDLAEYVDVRGMHKLAGANPPAEDLRALWAYIAYSKTPAGTARFPRDQVSDVTAFIEAAGLVLKKILVEKDETLLAAGDAAQAAEEALNAKTFVQRIGNVLVRRAHSARDFCNALYTDPSGDPGVAIVSHNLETGAVTISLAEPVPGVSCRTIVQNLWGQEAGGHDGIAGSPRAVKMTEEDFNMAVTAMVAVLN